MCHDISEFLKEKKEKLKHVWLKMGVQLEPQTGKVTQTVLKLIWKLRSPLISPMFLPSSVSFGAGPEDAEPNGHSEEGHPLGVVLGTNAAATFPSALPICWFWPAPPDRRAYLATL